MNILIVSVSEKGGAGYSSKNLYEGLLKLGINVHYLSFESLKNEKVSLFTRLYRWWNVRKNINRNYDFIKDAPQGYDYFTFARTGYAFLRDHPLVKSADLINLHWISNMIDYPSFFKALNKPIIWTLHDTNPFTGGCHYNFGCNHFLTDCSNCPLLSESVRYFAAKNNLTLKQDSLKQFASGNMAVISPSKWLSALSKRSALFKSYNHFHIPNGIDTMIFKRRDQDECRRQLNLPTAKFIILFVGTSLNEYRKGFDVILHLSQIFKDRSEILFLAVGRGEIKYEGISSLGYIKDKHEIAVAYNAADVFLIPSREDNLPNTMIESLCCGTPVIGFKTGGIVDAIDHGNNGFLVEKEDMKAISEHLNNMISFNHFNREQIADNAAEKYTLINQAAAYRQIMNSLMTQ